MECWRQTYSRLLPPDYFSQDPVGQRLPMSQNIVATSAERPAVVAEQDDLLIGFALAGAPIHPDPPRPLQLYNLYLHADHHGSGAGQALIDAVISGVDPCWWTFTRVTAGHAGRKRVGRCRTWPPRSVSVRSCCAGGCSWPQLPLMPVAISAWMLMSGPS